MIVGIDLGTCNGLAAYLSHDGHPVVVPDCHNKSAFSTPSAVVLNPGQALVGELAESYALLFPDEPVLRFFKRKFGTSEPVWVGPDGQAWFSESLGAIQLTKLAHDVQMFTGEAVSGAVVTVPAHFSDLQRKSVMDAADLADLPLLGIIEEPVAASIQHSDSFLENELILVFDLGGGTFDLTIVTKIGTEFHVLAKDGLPQIGGKEFTGLVADRIQAEYQKAIGLPLSSNNRIQNKLHEQAEAIKLKLSDPIMAYAKHQVTLEKACLEMVISRDVLKEGMMKLMGQVSTCVSRCLMSVGIPFAQINKIVLVGGGCLLPEVREYWESKVDGSSQKILFSDPFQSVAKGAAKYASSLHKRGLGLGVQPFKLRSVSSFSLAIQSPSQGQGSIDILIQKNLPLPVSANRIFELQAGRQIELELIQFWDIQESKFLLGTTKIGPYKQNIRVSLTVENREDGTIGMKVRNADDQKEIPFSFSKKASKYKFSMEEQKKLLKGTLVNLIS